ncbi:uncharacterized protein LOC116292332 [Actinia tenebrosa]|uniref:Uncharacterized protein LOC116292332 n=1 Tax=Actinia tenebrosa TaxID=6105 RepID=A0A6P8HKP8_ACTTE|nr:uncharacterized protein LOC116292332 [Actinia tenebrosa]
MNTSKRRPFKVYNSQRSKRKGVVAENLGELKEKGCQSLGLTASSCRVFIDSDGTEIEDDEYFSFIEEQSVLMLVEDGEDWSSFEDALLPQAGTRTYSSFNPSLESNESLEMDHADALVPISEFLVQQIRKNAMFFVSFSDEQLQTVIDCDLAYLAMVLGAQAKEVQHYKETCQRELDKRAEMREAGELLKLYDKGVRQNAASSASEPGSKRVKTH